MAKLTPEDLSELVDEIKRVQKDFDDVLSVEPRIKAPLDEALSVAERRLRNVQEHRV